MKASKEILMKICEALIKYDPSIVEIVQFGSSVYMPKYAHDLDLLIFTKKEKEFSGYTKCFAELEKKHGTLFVEPCIVEVGKPIAKARDFLIGLVGAHRILHGDGRHLNKGTEEVRKWLKNPKFEDAYIRIKAAKRYFKLAMESKEDLDFRIAFDCLAHASRLASLIYLAKENMGWHSITRTLDEISPKFAREFEEHFRTLHIRYYYDGDYPKDRVKEKFAKWTKRVEKYVRSLETELKREAKGRRERNPKQYWKRCGPLALVRLKMRMKEARLKDFKG